MNEQIIYVKFSNDRKRDFRIRTEIAECGGQKTVRKIAACKEAVPHVRRMYAEYRLLTEVYGETRFVPNRCELKGDTAEFEYLDGRTMEEILDRLYDTDRDAFRSLLRRSPKTSVKRRPLPTWTSSSPISLSRTAGREKKPGM